MPAVHPRPPAGPCLVLLVFLSALPGCRSGLQQSHLPQRKKPGVTVLTTNALPVPLIVKAVTGVLLERRPAAVDLARRLGGTAVKDDLAGGYRIRNADARFGEVYVRVSAISAHPYREVIDDVALLVKPGVLHLSSLSHVFGKPGHAQIKTTFSPGPRDALSGHYDERITVAFPGGPGAGYRHDPGKNPIELDLSARLVRDPGPDSPDPLVVEVDIYRSDWSDTH